ncbi:MAG: SpoIIE family protein phosphatase [Acidobacteriota bacterium]
MARLRVEPENSAAGPHAAYEIPLHGDAPFTIGRSPSNDLHFSDRWLSRRHAVIVRRQDAHVLRDESSRNGTYLNGERLHGERPLRHGDRVAIGEVRMRYLADPDEIDSRSEGFDPGRTVFVHSSELVFDRYQEMRDDGPARADSLLPALNRAASALIAHHPMDSLVELVLELIHAAVPAERSALMLLDGPTPTGGRARRATDALRPAATRGYGDPSEVQLSRTVADAVLERRTAVLTLDALHDERFDSAESIVLQNIRAIICVPLWHGDTVRGLVYLDQGTSDRSFTENDLRLVGLIANMAAVKMENLRLLDAKIENERLQQQLTLGARIQRQLLPAHAPAVAGYDIAGDNRSCYAVGGDYYDYVVLEDGRIALVIADISGKGVAAALLMASLRASLRALIPAVLSEPAALLARLNRVLLETTPYNKFATVFYALLDPQAHSMVYANGGHCPPLHVQRARGTLEALQPTGPLVGMIDDAAFDQRVVTCDPGDVFLLYTDGVSELTADTAGAGELYGTERLSDAMQRAVGLAPAVARAGEADAGDDDAQPSAADVLAAVHRDMRHFVGGDVPFDDDCTMIVVRRT